MPLFNIEQKSNTVQMRNMMQIDQSKITAAEKKVN